MKRLFYIPLLLALLLCAASTRAQLSDEQLAPLLSSSGLKPTIDLDFRNLQALPSYITFSRGGNAAWDWGCNGSLVPFSTNSIRNNSMQGAVVGTPGTQPTNWSYLPGTPALSSAVVAIGTQSGIDYIDVRIFGSIAGAGSAFIAFDTTTVVAAAQNQAWADSVFLALQAGSFANVTSTTLQIGERTNTGIATGTVDTSAALSIGASLTQQSFAFTVGNATTAFLFPTIQFIFPASGAVDFTIRIGWPILEQGMPYANPNPATLRTTGAAVSQPMLPVCDPLSAQNIGWGIWPASGSQQLTWGNDFTQATWVKTNVTAALNRTGPDGVSNSASSLTVNNVNCATVAGGCTVIGSGSAGAVQVRAEACYVKRETGTSGVYMTADNGANWTPITRAINNPPAGANGWVRVPRQGLYSINVSPQKLGFKFDAGNDVIDVWGCQFENDQNSIYYAPSPAIFTQGTGNLSRSADVATVNLAALPNFNLDSWWFVARVFVPYQWRGFGWSAVGQRRTIFQIGDGQPTGSTNTINVNFQADTVNGSASCQYGAGALAGPSCPDVNMDTKIAGVNNSKVRCSTAGSGIATFIPPRGGAFFTVAASYDRLTGLSIVCNNGYGDATVNDTQMASPAYASGALTTLQIGGSTNFAGFLGGYLTTLRGGSPALHGAALVAVAKLPQAPSMAQQYLGLNSGECLGLNGGGCLLVVPLGN